MCISDFYGSLRSTLVSAAVSKKYNAVTPACILHWHMATAVPSSLTWPHFQAFPAPVFDWSRVPVPHRNGAKPSAKGLARTLFCFETAAACLVLVLKHSWVLGTHVKVGWVQSRVLARKYFQMVHNRIGRHETPSLHSPHRNGAAITKWCKTIR